MKIYTKRGDDGQTQLFGGARVSKDHWQVEAYGTIDELNSTLGLIHATFPHTETRSALIGIQNRLFDLGAYLATDPSKPRTLTLTDGHVEYLERAIDRMDAELPALRNFILPGGDLPVSHCHLARTVCRRAERRVVALSSEMPIEALAVRFLNRLSDYLFVLSRWIGYHRSVEEIHWTPA